MEPEPRRQTGYDDHDGRRHLLRGAPKGKKKTPKKPIPYNAAPLALTKIQAANELQISIRTLDELIKKGVLRARQLKSKHTIRILRTDLVDFLEKTPIN